MARDCLRRRAGGESLSDEAILSSHRELMPELVRELAKLRLIRGALARAGPAGGSSRGAALPPSETPPPGLPIDALPGYSVIAEIHRGGQGVVYRALQHATKREVAIKVMREGPFAGPHDRARFEQEIQILASLKHPRIVTIHDSGTVSSLHYFVMDYIEGWPLDEYVARTSNGATKPPSVEGRPAPAVRGGAGDRSIDDTLRLFVKTCDAVNAAHLRGVIHRDLKPSNVRVDQAGEPHVLDFGLAKLDERLPAGDSGPQPLTITGQFVGSLPWASPEQVTGRTRDIDIRTDVYALGVVLYQLLTGRFPYRVTGPMPDVVRTILDATPQRPRLLRSDVNDELETIVLKCLSKEPERRYQSAGELQREIERYLAGEAIEAKRDSSWYVLRKAVRRHRLPVALTLGIVGIAFVAAVTFGIQTFRIAAQRDRAFRAEQLADQRLLEVIDARDAESNARLVSEEVNQILHGMLSAANPFADQPSRAETTVRELLDRAAMLIETDPPERPEVEAAVRDTIGAAYTQLGLHAEAREQLEPALDLRLREFGEIDLDVATTRYHLAELEQAQGRYAEAERECHVALAIRRELVGDASPDVAQSLTLLATLLRETGRYEEAETAGREALGRLRGVAPGESLLLARCANSLAGILRVRGELEQAESLYREALALRRAHLGDEHPDVAVTLNNLGLLLHERRDLDAASACYRAALSSMRKLLGTGHPSVARVLNNLANTLAAAGNFAEAERMYRETLDIFRESNARENADVATASNNLAMLLLANRRLDEAEPHFQDALRISRQELGDGHPTVAAILNNLGKLEYAQGGFESSERHLREALAIRHGVLPETHPDLIDTLSALARTLRAMGDDDEAAAFQAEATRLSATLREINSTHPRPPRE